MTDDYRTGNGPPDDVVVCRAVTGRASAIVVFASIVLFFGCFVASLFFATTVEVTCRHDLDRCVVTSSRPLLGVSEQTIPLSSVRGVAVISRRANKRASLTFSVVFLARDGGADIPIAGNDSPDLAARTRVKDQLELFITHPDAPALTVLYDRGQRWSLYMIPPLGILLGFVLWGLLQRTRVVFQWSEHRVRIERSRWPLASSTRSLKLAELRGVRLFEKEHSNPVELDVHLELHSGESIALLGRPFFLRAHLQAAVNDIDALLARRSDSDQPYL